MPTLAAYASTGSLLTLYCLKCRSPRRSFTSREIVETFGDSLLATVEDVCVRLLCRKCKHLGGFDSGFADRDSWREEGGRQASRDDEITIWQARDLFLRRLLAELGRPLEIADVVWAEVEGHLSYRHDWKPRVGKREGCPLSEAARGQLSKDV